MAEVRTHFRPEFINRLDELVVFHALSDKHIAGIARIQLERLTKRLVERDIGLEVTETALDEIALVGFDPLYGARPLKRAIQQHIENPLARQVLEGNIMPGQSVTVDFSEAGFTFEASTVS